MSEESNGQVPRPRARMLRTWFAIPRSVKPFYQPLSLQALYAEPAPPEEVAHWGRIEVLDEAVVVLHGDGTTTFRTRYIVHLHGDPDLREWEEFSTVYRPMQRKPRVIRSVLHLPDGSKKKAKVRHVALDAYGTRALVGQHTHLRPGVVLDHEVQDDTFKRIDIGPGIWGEYYLRTRWPCRRRRLTIAVADPFALRFNLHHGASAPLVSRVGKYAVYRWDLSDTAGIDADQWTPPPGDFCPLVDYSTLPSWRPLVEYFRTEMDPQCVKGHQSWADTQKVVAGAASDREKVSAIYKFAAGDVRYGRPNSQLEQRKIRTGTEIAQDLRGDCKDKSALMTAMLREVKIPAHVAVLRTRELGTQAMLPGPRFDHAVTLVKVDGQEMWLDAAAGAFTMGVIPYQDQGAQALVLLDGHADGEHRRIPAAQPSEHGMRRTCRGSLDAAGNLRYESSAEYVGERSAHLRFQLRDRNAEFRRRVLEFIEGDLVPGAQVEQTRADGVEDLLANVRVSSRAVMPSFARPLRDLLLLRVPWADAMIMHGPLISTARDIPLHSPPPAHAHETQEIELPQGFSAYGLPMERVEHCPWSSYRCEVRQEGNKLIARRTVEHAAGPTVIPPEQYAQFRAYWSKCARADAMDIVLFRGNSPF